MRQEVLWPLAFGLLLTGLFVQLMRRKVVAVPISAPLSFMMCEICIFQWLWFGGWRTSVYICWLLGFVFVGCTLLYQSFGARRWYYFHGGSFWQDMDAYETVAKVIDETLQRFCLPPATIIFRRDGWLGLMPLEDEVQEELMKRLHEATEDSKWQKWGAWHFFFGVQWLVICLMLLYRVIEMSGGI